MVRYDISKRNILKFFKRHSRIFLESVGRNRAIICDKFTMKKDVKKFLKGRVRYLEKKCQKFFVAFFQKSDVSNGLHSC